MPQSNQLKPKHNKPRQTAGFALIASLAIMAVLVMIAVALYSMSNVATRTAKMTSARTEAQANAKMALMMAVGKLQTELGPDQRITANAAILDSTPEIDDMPHPHWLGSWDSWIAGDPRQAPVNPDYPGLNDTDTHSHHQTIGDQPEDSMRPVYDQKKNLYFRSWLVSLLDSDIQQNNPLSTPANLAFQGQLKPAYDPSSPSAVQLVGEVSLGGVEGSISKSEDYVSARLVPIPDVAASQPKGRFGWWVGDESQKAMVIGNSYERSDPQDLAEKLFRQQAPASLGNSEIPGMENLADQSELFSIPNRETLALINGATSELREQFHHVTPKSLGVLADVREGGLKRDLSTILERSIDPAEVYELTNLSGFQRATALTSEGEDFMLYNFDDMVDSADGETTGQAAVPIQDLAAYYQLYNRYRTDSMGGIQFSSDETSPPNNELSNGIMVSSTDYGWTSSDYENYLRQYTALYRNPVLVKIEVLLSFVSEPILPAPTDPDQDTHRLRLGISPALTFWNPNNVPLVMRFGDPEKTAWMTREYPIPLNIAFKKESPSATPGGGTTEEVKNIEYGEVTETNDELYSLFVFGNYPAVFEPGETKVFALRYASETDAESASSYVDFAHRGEGGQRGDERFLPELELVSGWNPDKFVRPKDTESDGTAEAIFTFKADDEISAIITAGDLVAGTGSDNKNSFNMGFIPKSRHGFNIPGTRWDFRHSMIRGRYNADESYRDGLVYQGFPLEGASGISDPSVRTIEIAPRQGQTLINAMGNPFNPNDDLPQAFFYYSMRSATETHESNYNEGEGRRFPARPFTHSTPMAPTFLDSLEPTSLYNYGWNWFFRSVDNPLDAPISISNSNSGYFGGGYTAGNGTTNVIQQQLPLTPPLSIATLSHAHLGGFSIATESAANGFLGVRDANSERFRRTTAVGFGGLQPRTLQAIGNSYAHPNIPAEQAWSTWDRQIQGTSTEEEPFVDHSYLANKALWDEFFFSSITPKPGQSKAFSQDKSAEEAAEDFFFPPPDNSSKPLPNPRIKPSLNGLNESLLSDLLDEYDTYQEGFADKIAGHLLVEGPFNVNSTSVTAWKALFSSLKGQEVSYLDAESALSVGTNLDFEPNDGVPITGGPLPSGRSYEGSSNDPSESEQWTGYRVLTDTEIENLAEAMVEQVKRRGPFLSLSEFVNRRLDASNTDDMALMGALQAAIDDPDTGINSGFDSSDRQFTGAEKAFMGSVEFSEALEGPIAYGSSAYVDQADILKNFPAQLTPRGDTFVVRAYGDTLDAQGRVEARAWCEAIVQRIPEYVDPSADEAHLKQSELLSESNRKFGRKFKMLSFRWLDSSEI